MQHAETNSLNCVKWGEVEAWSHIILLTNVPVARFPNCMATMNEHADRRRTHSETIHIIR